MSVRHQLRELLQALASALSQALMQAADDYPAWISYTWQDHKTDIDELWQEIFDKLQDRLVAESVNNQIVKMVAAFDRGHTEVRRSMARRLCQLPIEVLR